MKKQVEKSHYEFKRYMTKERWASVWHQLNEVLIFNPTSVLEVGPGPGIFKCCAENFGIMVQSLDPDPELKPDYVANADKIPIPDKTVDVSCAFQVLEHMPIEVSIAAVKELCRVSRKGVIISLPQSDRVWRNQISIPYVRSIDFLFGNPLEKRQAHTFDGEHYWEIGKLGYELPRITEIIQSSSPLKTQLKTFRVRENPYHRFFTLALPTG